MKTRLCIGTEKAAKILSKSTKDTTSWDSSPNYIGEGSRRIKASYSDILQINGVECVAFENTDGSITLIALNDSESEREVKIKGGYANVKEIVTNASENWKIKRVRKLGKSQIEREIGYYFRIYKIIQIRKSIWGI